MSNNVNFSEKLKEVITMNKTQVFVYGTLKRGYGNSRLIPEHVDHVEDSVTGFSMYHMGGFPGVVQDEEGTVQGQVFLVDDACLERLNRLEGFVDGSDHNFYERINTITDGGLEVCIYIQALRPSSKYIPDGVWNGPSTPYKEVV